jgi:hypothetical protein
MLGQSYLLMLIMSNIVICDPVIMGNVYKTFEAACFIGPIKNYIFGGGRK